jgi:large subunit ribosomal protein L34e
MPTPSHRSRTFRRIHKRTPGGKTVMHYVRRKPSKHTCGKCGKVLSGMPRELPYKIRAMSKSERRPTRVFGGNLCSACSRSAIKAKARV